METRANYALVGLFTLAVIAATFGFVYWFRSASNAGERTPYRIVFNGSVSGLSKGAAVRFNGLRVGEVLSVELMTNDPSRVSVQIAVDPTTPMRTDTRARLDVQTLTGAASIQLTGAAGNAPALQNPDGRGAPTIFADRSDFQDLMETAQRLAGRIDGIIGRVDKFLAENEAPLSNTLRNVEGFSKALNDNSPAVSSFISQMTSTAQRFSSLSDRIDKLSEAAEGILRGVDAGSINRSISSFETFMKGLSDNKGNIDTMLSEASGLAKRLNDSAPKLDEALADASKLLRAIDADKVNRTLDGAEKFASALGANAKGVDQALKDVADITRKVSQSADRLDSVMKGAENLLGSGDTKGVMAEITETARSIRRLADNLDKRTAEITSGINRFTGPGLRDLEALTADARKAINDVGRAVRNLERNPQQLITGGRSSVPEFSGR